MSSSGMPQHWRTIKERYRLLGSHCGRCNTNFFPTRNVCPNCRRKGKIASIGYAGRGKVYSYTVVHAAARAFEAETPYVIGLVQLEEGPKVLSQIVDCQPGDVTIGMDVESCFRRISEQEDGGIISYGFKFRPADKSWEEYYE